MFVTAIEYHIQPCSAPMITSTRLLQYKAHWVLTDGRLQEVDSTFALAPDRDSLYQSIADHAKANIGPNIIASNDEWIKIIHNVLSAPFKGKYGTLEDQEVRMRFSWPTGPQDVGRFQIHTAHIDSVEWLDPVPMVVPDLLGLANDICAG
jgi:hypothetical protein